eukprot:SAG22_NODE_1962_length_3242_cov_2.053452_1_plen_265_part_00
MYFRICIWPYRSLAPLAIGARAMVRMPLLLVLLLQGSGAAALLARPLEPNNHGLSRRAVSWWAAPTTAADAAALVVFAKEHRSVVTTVILECGVLTCCRTGTGQCGNEKNTSLPGYRYTCTNNGGVGGVVTGNLSDACAQTIPQLTKLGVRSEIWLGEDDSLSSARFMFSHAKETAESLVSLARAHPGLVGFNIGAPPPASSAGCAASAMQPACAAREPAGGGEPACVRCAVLRNALTPVCPDLMQLPLQTWKSANQRSQRWTT